jgi:nickel-dependent lactate racemase
MTPTQSVDLTWKAWHGNERLTLPLPAEWEVRVCGMDDAPTLGDEAIIAALRAPVAGPTLTELARQKMAEISAEMRVCIAVDDLARPTETWRILPTLLDDLNAAGLPDSQLFVVISLGTHRQMTRADLLKKLGEPVLRRVKVRNHSAYQNLVTVGETSYGTPVEINKDYAEADLKIGVGMLSPHGFAGYSGGGKIIMPGLAGFNTVLRNHRPVIKGLSGRTGQVKGNTRRADIEEAARIAGMDWLVNTVSNARAETSAVFAGEPEAVFLTAAEAAQHTYRTEVAYQNDVAIFNAFPKDHELIQALNSLNVWTSQEPERLIVKPGGTVVFVTAATEGVGVHGLFGPGGALFVRRDKHGLFADILQGREVAFFSPNLYPPDLIDIYPPSVQLFREWPPLLEWLAARHPGRAAAAVFPTGPLQLAAEDIEALDKG